MKKIILLLVVSFIFNSCSFPSYVLQNGVQTTGLDFTKGTWLLNRIDVPIGVQEKITKDALNYFTKNIKERFNYTITTKGLLIPNKINLNPNRSTLKDLKIGTNFNFFINIKASKVEKSNETLVLSPNRLNTAGQNVSSVTIEVYDLDLLEIIYSQKVIASSVIPKDRNDLHFFITNSSLILGGFKKLMKDIDKKSIK